MSAINTGGPAFPQHGWSSNQEVRRMMEQSGHGMTLRDYFAAQSIAGINPGRLYGDDGIQTIADQAYKLADAMLAAREKGSAK